MPARVFRVGGAVAVLVVSSCGSGGRSSGKATWRLVADADGRLPESPMVATTTEAFDAMARTVAMPGASPIDVGTEIAIGIGVGSPCLRIVDVDVHIGAHLVRPIIEPSKSPCSTIAISRVIIVVVRRDRLPPLPFTVQTKTTRCERNCDGTPLVVDSL